MKIQLVMWDQHWPPLHLFHGLPRWAVAQTFYEHGGFVSRELIQLEVWAQVDLSWHDYILAILT
jgi:hypothetical protein